MPNNHGCIAITALQDGFCFQLRSNRADVQGVSGSARGQRVTCFTNCPWPWPVGGQEGGPDSSPSGSPEAQVRVSRACAAEETDPRGCVGLELGKEGLLLLGEQSLLFLHLCSWFLLHSLEGKSSAEWLSLSLGPPAIHLFTHSCCVPDLGPGYRGSQDRPHPTLKVTGQRRFIHQVNRSGWAGGGVLHVSWSLADRPAAPPFPALAQGCSAFPGVAPGCLTTLGLLCDVQRV